MAQGRRPGLASSSSRGRGGELVMQVCQVQDIVLFLSPSLTKRPGMVPCQPGRWWLSWIWYDNISITRTSCNMLAELVLLCCRS
jgi:hypothetical protein